MRPSSRASTAEAPPAAAATITPRSTALMRHIPQPFPTSPALVRGIGRRLGVGNVEIWAIVAGRTISDATAKVFQGNILLRSRLSPLRVCPHDLRCLVLRQSCLQEVVDGPAPSLDEIRHEQPVSRIEAILHHHRDIHGSIAERAPQLFERLTILDGHIVGETFPYPSRHAKASETDMFPDNDVSELVSA